LTRSHIIPEFMYGSLFDKHHKMYKLRPAEFMRGIKKVVRQTSGEYESNVLCEECDTLRLNQYESYAKEVVRKTHSRILLNGCDDETTPEGIKFRRCDGVDCRKFKLFLLSILWRASISTREMFREIMIGHEHEEAIRSMIMKADPGQGDQYPVIMISHLGDPATPGDLVGQPGSSPVNGRARFVFPIGGVTYLFHLSMEAVPDGFQPYILQDIGLVKLLYTPKGMAWNLLMNYFGANPA
jgi:hypothetical protein